MIASHTDEAPHYFYVPYSKDPQDGLKLVRLGKSNELRLSFSNMEYLSNQSDLRASPLSPSPLSNQPDLKASPLSPSPLSNHSDLKASPSCPSPLSNHSDLKASPSCPRPLSNQPNLNASPSCPRPLSNQPNIKASPLSPSPLSNQPDLRASPLSPSPLSKQPYGSIQSTQYFYQQLPEHQYLQSPTLDNYLSAQPQHYFREPQTQFSTSQVAGQETQSEYFYKKFQQQRLLCIYLQELSLKQQKEMLFLKKALNELQYITVRSLRGK